jgi:hypothetical protein
MGVRRDDLRSCVDRGDREETESGGQSRDRGRGIPRTAISLHRYSFRLTGKRPGIGIEPGRPYGLTRE